MNTKQIIGFLIGLNIILTGYLTLNKTNDNTFCLITSSCDVVQNSIYSSLFGIPLSNLGLLSFSLLGLCYLFQSDHLIRKLFVLGALLAGILAIYFIILQAFVIRAFCSSCLIIDGIAIAITCLVIYYQLNR